MNAPPIADSRTYLWLAIAVFLGMFAFGAWTMAVAPWFYVLFSIRFIHTQKAFRGYVILSLVSMVHGAMLVWQGVLPASLLPPEVLYAAIVVGSFVDKLPYLADRLLFRRVHGFAASLVFPAAFTAWEFVRLTNNPLGSFGSLGYSQYGDLPLMQLVSVTGIWGLTFLICWFASTVNWAWEQSFSWPSIQRGVLVYAAVVGLVLAYGGSRLVFAPRDSGTVRIASFTAVDNRRELSWSLIGKDREAFRRMTSEFHERYLEETRRQAEAGAKLVLWPELAGVVTGEDEAVLLDRMRNLARDEDIYLVVPLFTLHSDKGRASENKLIAVDPAGEIVLEHYKYGGNIVEGSVAGDGVLQTFETPFATVSGVICWDMDFPATVNQAGRNGTDILLAPALDWLAVSTTHAHMSVFRAIENGVALVRHADNGLSIATDPYGRVLASLDHFGADRRLMVVEVPTSGVTTIYSILGDWFGWIAGLGFLMIVVVTVIQRRRRS